MITAFTANCYKDICSFYSLPQINQWTAQEYRSACANPHNPMYWFRLTKTQNIITKTGDLFATAMKVIAVITER